MKLKRVKSVGAAVSGPIGGDYSRPCTTPDTHRVAKSLAQTLDPADILVPPHIHTSTDCS